MLMHWRKMVLMWLPPQRPPMVRLPAGQAMQL
jgi:hypothetical protein